MANKLKSYDDATRKLMQQAYALDVESTGPFQLPEMVYLLRESFKQKLTYRKVFPEVPLHVRECEPSTGFCLISSYYIYQHTGGGKVWDIEHNPLHWWLRHKQTGAVFDVTYTQFNEAIPYAEGLIESRIAGDETFTKILQQKAMALGKAARMDK